MDEIWIHGEPGKDARIILVTQYGVPIIKKIGEATKAQTALKAIITALEFIKTDEKREKIIIFTDSDLVYGQLIKGWPITSNASLSWKAKKLFKKNKDMVILRMIDKKDNLAMKKITCEI
jgi:ribonuclease HI